MDVAKPLMNSSFSTLLVSFLLPFMLAFLLSATSYYRSQRIRSCLFLALGRAREKHVIS